MSIKVTVPNTSSDSVVFGSANTPTAAEVVGIDSGSSNGQLAFKTTASGTSTERMRIDASGNVGIGTSSPNISSATTKALTITSASGQDDAMIEMTQGSTIYGRLYSNGNGLGITGVGGIGMRFYTASTFAGAAERMRIDSSGNVLVGTTDSAATSGVGLKANYNTTQPYYATVASASTNATGTGYLYYSTGAGAYRFYVGAGGTVFATSTTISAISDIRYKENVRDLDVGLDAVMALKPRKFDWKEGKGKDIKGDRGFIAQEFEQVFPDLIDEWKDPAPEGEEPYKSVRQDLIPVLVKAIQELKAELDTVKSELATLKGTV